MRDSGRSFTRGSSKGFNKLRHSEEYSKDEVKGWIFERPMAKLYTDFVFPELLFSKCKISVTKRVGERELGKG